MPDASEKDLEKLVKAIEAGGQAEAELFKVVIPEVMKYLSYKNHSYPLVKEDKEELANDTFNTGIQKIRDRVPRGKPPITNYFKAIAGNLLRNFNRKSKTQSSSGATENLPGHPVEPNTRPASEKFMIHLASKLKPIEGLVLIFIFEYNLRPSEIRQLLNLTQGQFQYIKKKCIEIAKAEIRRQNLFKKPGDPW
jgi:DNA-directed RNA polymerase specialized sigma24 family protein